MVSNQLEKLNKLKKQQKSFSFNSFKSGMVARLYTWITLLLMVIIFLSSFLNSFSASINQVDQKKESWLETISLFYELNQENKQKNLQKIKEELSFTIKNTASFVLLSSKVDEDIQKIIDLFDKWLLAFGLFLEYRFSVDGITNIRDKNRFFTEDLSLFFTENKRLFEETKSLWNSFWFYKFWINFSGQQKLQKIIRLADNLLEIGDYIFQNPKIILDFLGHDQPRKIVIFNQNTAEARPTGGFIGSHIPLTINKGKVEIGQSQSIHWIQGSHKKPRIASPFLTNYGMVWGANYILGGVSDTFNFPCFPTSAAFLQREFAESSAGYKIDDVVFITPEVLSQLLPPTFTFTVTNLGTFSSSELLSEINRVTALEYQNPQNPKEALTPILNSILLRLPEILEFHKSNSLISILTGLFLTRDIQIWSSTPETQKLFSNLSLTGEQTCQNKQKQDIVAPILFNISGDKRNGITANSWSISSKNVIGGQRVRVSYQQEIEDPENIPRGSFNQVMPFTFVGLQIPSTAQNIDVYSPQSLRRQFLPSFYLQKVQENVPEYETTPEIDLLWKTGKDLSEGANPPGFTYQQPDGSTVTGIYIADDLVSEVTFEFTLPVQNHHLIKFFPQAGVNKPLLSLGEGVQNIDYPNQKLFQNRKQNLSGLSLILGY